jgi:hypothetical protein
MATNTQTATDEKASTIQHERAQNARGDWYDYYRCAGCGVEAITENRTRTACDCGGFNA